MARGSESKDKITKEILEHFKGAFLYDKEIRIPIEENGEVVQIKVSLACAKENVEVGQENALPGAAAAPIRNSLQERPNYKEIVPTEEEKKNVNNLLQALGL